jgi:hypothetical protein
MLTYGDPTEPAAPVAPIDVLIMLVIEDSVPIFGTLRPIEPEKAGVVITGIDGRVLSEDGPEPGIE